MYNFYSDDIPGIKDGWVDEINTYQVTWMLEKAIGIKIPNDIISLFNNIYRCGGDGCRAEVENSQGKNNLDLQLCKYENNWEVLVTWKPEHHHVEFRENTTDIMKSLEWILDKIPA